MREVLAMQRIEGNKLATTISGEHAPGLCVWYLKKNGHDFRLGNLEMMLRC